ncbi:ATP12 family protein [Mangrovicoccus ximenensis]|uniref:ATP12 family protein n=1 Tax=Mangrovicoccus ximenensis TaxID=1911570 RepID=UPI001F1CAFE6|nr:ATP12 family protein [Mangrovicoccus ximenensis]
MAGWVPKRFWKEAAVAEAGDGWTVQLDGRAVKTPAKAALVLPSRAYAEAVAAEWDAQEETVNPAIMPLTKLANSAIDNVAPNHAAVAGMLAEYGGTDLLCYRAEAPADLVARQRAAWDPLLIWSAGRFGAPLNTGSGIMHVAQPAESLAALAAEVRGLTAFELAAFHDLVAMSGSLILALAVAHGEAEAEAAWAGPMPGRCRKCPPTGGFRHGRDDAFRFRRRGRQALPRSARVAPRGTGRGLRPCGLSGQFRDFSLQCRHAACPLCRGETNLRRRRAVGIDRHPALPDRQIPPPVLHGQALRPGCPDPGEAHPGPRCCLRDRFGACSISFRAWRQASHSAAASGERPVRARSAPVPGDAPGRLPPSPRRKGNAAGNRRGSSAPERPAEHGLSPVTEAVALKHALRDIGTNHRCGNRAPPRQHSRLRPTGREIRQGAATGARSGWSGSAASGRLAAACRGGRDMNGAETLVETFLSGGVEICFANPGTSEMHFVAALDSHPRMRCILGLFEGVVTGAADGYFRMARSPAATLLHLAPGFGNGYASIHNARKAHSGMINVVGDHADYHLKYDAPLKGDIEGVTRGVSDWLRVSPDALAVAGDGAGAIRAARARNGQIATLVLPANTAWEEAAGPAAMLPPVLRSRTAANARRLGQAGMRFAVI